ncbi:DUF637 domain-containing protein [Devosia sp. MC1541]|uniref:two-partner secretion domain-containing protein n=1 Tax=Devosia sp. MC1541 TaxID=2725264 RepID=UPI00145E52C4|nr:DUF637 domain-containing protein [Devosia sp. MC1541]
MRQSWSSRLLRAARLSVALFTTGNLVVQTTVVTYAQSLAVDPSGTGTIITTAPNGVPLVNIAPANDAGLSHNRYTDFNVGNSGLILNNATAVGQSELGGIVNANPNLDGGSASLILNEVTSTNTSLLAGVIEIHGVAADLVIANPNGITCSGCGFINTPRATLATGNPVIGPDGKLSKLAVTGGVVEVGSGGLDASNVDYFDIISRSAILNGALHGKDVGIFLGANDFDYDARTVGQNGIGSGSTPAFALDSSALGGMYAGRITLEGTEAGVGVRMPDNVVAGAGGMSLTSSGKLVLNSASSSGNVSASATDRLEITGGVYSGGTLRLSAGQDLALDSGYLAAWNDVSLSGIGIELDGDLVATGVDGSGSITAGKGTLSITASGDLHIGANTTVRGGNAVLAEITGDSTLLGQLASDGDLSLRTANLTLGNGAVVGAGLDSVGLLAGSADLDISAERIDATGAQILSSGEAVIASTGDLSLVGGELRSGGNITVSGTGALSNAMRMKAASDLSLNAVSVANTADLLAGEDLVLLATAGVASNTAKLEAGHSLEVNGSRVVQNGELSALDEIRLVAGADGLIHSGALEANGAIDVTSDGGIVLSGSLRSAEAVSVGAAHTVSILSGGELVARGDISIEAENLNNSGAIGAGRDLEIGLDGWLLNSDLIAAKRHIDIRLDGALYNTGTIFSAENLSIAGLNQTGAASVTNTDALIEANAGHLSINAGTIENTTTGISVGTTSSTTTSGAIPLIVETTITREYLIGTINRARLLAGSDLTLVGDDITNTYSLIAANGDVTLTGDNLVNTARDLIETTQVTTRSWWEETYCDSLQVFGGCWSGWKYRWIESPPTYSTASATIGGIYSTIQATGALSGDFTDRIDNIAIRQGAGQVGLSSGVGTTAPGLVSVNLTWSNSSGSAPSIDLSGYLAGGSLHQIVPDPTSPYLIETRSEFVDLSKFYNSDGFLSTLTGFDPELTQKRLGDAYVETRIIQEQIAALTGRRFLDGFDTDYDQVKALYDNALAAQASLNLSPGAALTAEQVAALTSDIIWYETTTVDGIEVLVPRVYLANTAQDGQAGGAQLLGNRIILASADMTNTGLVSADDSLDIGLTGDLLNLGGAIYGHDVVLDIEGSLLNLSGMISGGDVAIAAGDLVNQTASTRDNNATGFADRVDQTASIVAQGNLDIATDGDFSSIGGNISAGDDLAVSAGGDINIAALEQETSSSITFNEGFDNRYSLTNQLATVSAGGNIDLSAGGDATLLGAEVAAGGDVHLAADGDVTVAAVQDITTTDRSVTFEREGVLGFLFGSDQTTTEQHQSVTTSGGGITAGGNIGVTSAGGDIALDAATIAAEGKVELAALDGSVTFSTNIDSDFERRTRDTESLLWWTASDAGSSTESVVHTMIQSGGGLDITTSEGIVVQYRETGDLSASIDQLSQIEGLAWLDDLRDRPDVDWQAVTAAQENWDYYDQGLTEAGAALVALAVAAVSGGTGLGASLTSSIAGSMGLAGNAIAMAAIDAGVTALLQKTTISMINNQGDLAAVLAELGSESTLRSLVGSILTAGLTQGALDIAQVGAVTPGANFGQNFGQNFVNAAQTNLIKAAIKVGVSTTVEGQPLDQSLISALRLAAADTLGQSVATEIGVAAKSGQIDVATQMIAHAALGCATGAVAAGDCVGGAAGAAGGEAAALLMLENWTRSTLVQLKSGTIQEADLAADYAAFRSMGINVATLTGGLTALIVGGDVSTGGMTGGNAASNNAFPVLLAMGVLALLEATDRALIVSDGIRLARALDACNAGNIAACGQAEQIHNQLVFDGVVELSIGVILPGSKIATDLGRWAKSAVAPNVGTNRFTSITPKNADEAEFLANAEATFGVSSTWTGVIRHRDELVIQRADIELSDQNITRMKNGQAPFVRGANGAWEPLQLHHVGRETGQMIEVTQSQNQYNPLTGGPLHIPGPGSPLRQSGYSHSYWQMRYADFVSSGLISP